MNMLWFNFIPGSNFIFVCLGCLLRMIMSFETKENTI